MRPRRSKKGPRGLWGPILTPLGPLRTSNLAVLSMKFHASKEPLGVPGALCKTSKSNPRYSFCQKHSKIFQDKPLKASLLERKPGSLQERIPQRARAGLKGWAAVPRRRRLGLNPPPPTGEPSVLNTASECFQLLIVGNLQERW